MSRLEVAFRHQHQSGFALDIAFQTAAQVTALFGPSGAGKSTILDVLAGILRPTAGSVRFDDEVWFDSTARADRAADRRGVGMVFQDHRLFPHLTVAQNLMYGANRDAQNGPLREWVEALELGPRLHQYPAALSGGERHRVALGRAILRRPKLLLLDEPFAALDGPLKQRVIGALQAWLASQNVMALIVSHDRADVEALASMMVRVDRGRVTEVAKIAPRQDLA